MTLIDTHCHLNDPSFADTLPEVISRARAVGVGAVIVPAYDTASLARTAELALLYPGLVYPAYGLHPWYIETQVDFERLESYARREEAVAIGEIGLDFSPECPPAGKQERVFIHQLDMAARLCLPVLIHCRKAFDRLYDLLKPYEGKITGVLHSYSGGKAQMPRFLDLGFYIAFSGSVTRQNARKYHACAEAAPPERLLLETDAPSIATESTVASQVEPAHVLEVARKIADLRALPLSDICHLSTQNARRLFPRLADIG